VTLTSTQDVIQAFAQLMDLQAFEESNLPERYRQYKLINDLLGEVLAARNEMQDSLFDDMEGDIVDLPGIGVFKRVRGGRYSKWDSDGLLRAIRSRILDELKTEDGTVPTIADAIHDTVATMAKVSGCDRPSHGWRTGELKVLGIAPATYATYEEGTSRRVDIVA